MLRALLRRSPRLATALALAVLTAGLGYSLSHVSASPKGGGKGGKTPPPSGKSSSSSSSSSSPRGLLNRLFGSNSDKKKTKKQPAKAKPEVGNIAAGALSNPLSDGRPFYPNAPGSGGGQPNAVPSFLSSRPSPQMMRSPISSSSPSSSSSNSPQGAVSRAGSPPNRPMSTIRQVGLRILARKRQEVKEKWARRQVRIEALEKEIRGLKSEQRTLVNMDQQLAQQQRSILAGPAVYFQGNNPPVVAAQGQNQGVSPSAVTSSSPSVAQPNYDRIPPTIVYSALPPNPKN